MPVPLKVPLGKGRKSQKQICIPYSRRAAPLSVETVGQKLRETRRASCGTAPLAWPAEKLLATVSPSVEDTFIQPLSSICTLRRVGGHPSFFHNPTPYPGVCRILNSPCFFVYYLKQKHFYLPHTKSLPVTTAVHRQSHSQLVIADQKQSCPEETLVEY